MRLLLYILLFISLPVLSQTNYYVKNGGDDSNNGTSDGTAWEHHPWMIGWTGGVTLQAGDTVFMNRGDNWSYSAGSSTLAYLTVAQSGSSGSPIVTTSYGSGDHPLIEVTGVWPHYVVYGVSKSFVTFDSLEIRHYTNNRTLGNKYGFVFTETGGVAPHDITITRCKLHRFAQVAILMYPNCYNIVVGDTTAVSTATTSDFSNEIYDCGYGGVDLTGCQEGTLLSNFKVYYNYIHGMNNSAVAVQNTYGITFGGTSTSNDFPSYATARYNRIDSVIAHEGLDCHGGKYIYFQDNYVKNCRLLIGLQAAADLGLTPLLDSVVVSGNTFENPGDNALGNLFLQLAGRQEGYRPTKIYINNNSFFFTTRPASANYALNVTWCDGVTINNNHIYNGASGSAGSAFYIGGSGAPTKNVSIYKNHVEDWYTGLFLYPNGIDGNIDVYYNIFYCHGYSVFSNVSNSYGGDLSFYNNAFVTKPTASYPYVIDLNSNTLPVGKTINVKNNIFAFSSSSSTARYFRTPGTVGGTLNIDYNLYWNSTFGSPFLYLGALKTWAQWQALGFDANSPNTTSNLDPLFTNDNGDYSEDTDFDIQSTSPAIDVGTDVSLTQDYADTTVPYNAVEDIGAYEYTPDNPPVNPIVLTTTKPYYTSPTTAVGGGNVTNDGGGTVSARGVCWATSSNPTIANDYTEDGTGAGVYSSTLTGLIPGVKYYVRAYATNEAGTSYGANKTFRVSYCTSGGKLVFDSNGKAVVYE